MKPDYYIHAHTRQCVETSREGDKYTHKKAQRRSGEHVMSYKVWALMKAKDVAAIIGPLAKDVK